MNWYCICRWISPRKLAIWTENWKNVHVFTQILHVHYKITTLNLNLSWNIISYFKYIKLIYLYTSWFKHTHAICWQCSLFPSQYQLPRHPLLFYTPRVSNNTYLHVEAFKIFFTWQLATAHHGVALSVIYLFFFHKHDFNWWLGHFFIIN